MAKLDVIIAHQLSSDEALKRIKGLLKNVKKQFSTVISDLEEEWDGNTGSFSFKVKGFLITGELIVKKEKVQIQGDLPFAISFAKAKIEKIIREKATHTLTE